MSSNESEIVNRLMKINKYYIRIGNRAPNTVDFDNISKFFIDKLKDYDVAFNKLYKGHRLAGSYADKLKIGEADEFDLIIKLKIDDSNDVQVTHDPDLPGYCNINLKNMMIKLKEKCDKDEAKIWYYKHFESLINDNGYLIQDKVHEWIERIMRKILHENLKDHNILKLNENTIYSIKYSTSGPAHTITLIRDLKSISIDLVPAFIFNETKWVVERTLSPILVNIIPKEDLYWIALPKPVKGRPKPNISFLTSFVDIERHLIIDRNNLKNTLKMLKKLRDRKGLDNLKSYFIKTIYLWENDVQNRTFWDQPPFIILKHMISKVIECLENKNLPFFWHREQNMFGSLSEQEINHMLIEMNDAYQVLLKQPNEIYNLFLTFDEQLNLEKYLAEPTETEYSNNATMESTSKSEESRAHTNAVPYQCSLETFSSMLFFPNMLFNRKKF